MQALGCNYGSHLVVSSGAVSVWFALFESHSHAAWRASGSISGDAVSDTAISCTHLDEGLSACLPLQIAVLVLLIVCWLCGSLVCLAMSDTALWRENDKKRLEVAGYDLANQNALEHTLSAGDKKVRQLTHIRSRGIENGKFTCEERLHVKEDQVNWSSEFPDYIPKRAPIAAVGESWTDGADERMLTKVEIAQIKQTRHTYVGWNLCPCTGMPRNPAGRTGWCGRGRLPRFGPNHCVDAVLTRMNHESGALEVAVIPNTISSRSKRVDSLTRQKSRDSKPESATLSLPGVFIKDADPSKTHATQRAIQTKVVAKVSWQMLDEIFEEEPPTLVFTGYVDDERNTDNAWIETTALMYSFSTKAHCLEYLEGVKWVPITTDLHLYGNHGEICLTAKQRIEAKGKFSSEIAGIRRMIEDFRQLSAKKSMPSVCLPPLVLLPLLCFLKYFEMLSGNAYRIFQVQKSPLDLLHHFICSFRARVV